MNDHAGLDALQRLDAIIAARLVAGDPTSSYVARLAAQGIAKVAQKVGEEAVETVIAAIHDDDDALIGEAADLLFHLSLLLRQRGLGWDDVAIVLDARHGQSGLAEKAARRDLGD